MKNIAILVIAVVSSFLVISPSFADAGGGSRQPGVKMASTDVFAGGMQATFMVMKNVNHESMRKNMKMNEKVESNTTHNVMIILRDEETGKEIKDVPIRITVTDPNDKEQTKTGSFKDMMKSYDAYFSMREKGKYLIRVLFETGGQKHSVGLSYDMS